MKTYSSQLLQGKLRTAVRWIIERETGGLMHPEEHCTKTGEREMEVLRTKNPYARPPSMSSLDT